MTTPRAFGDSSPNRPNIGRFWLVPRPIVVVNLRRAENELRSTEKKHYWAKHRLDKANDRLAGIGPLALLRRHGRNERSAALKDIERFGGDVVRAADKVASCKHNHDQLTDEVAQGVAWHLQHDWRRGRLNEIETELADLGHIDLRHIPLAERSPGLGRDRSRMAGQGLRPLARADASDVPAWWADRLAEIAAPPLPGKDAGLGIDLGL